MLAYIHIHIQLTYLHVYIYVCIYIYILMYTYLYYEKMSENTKDFTKGVGFLPIINARATRTPVNTNQRYAVDRPRLEQNLGSTTNHVRGLRKCSDWI